MIVPFLKLVSNLYVILVDIYIYIKTQGIGVLQQRNPPLVYQGPCRDQHKLYDFEICPPKIEFKKVI